VGLTTFIRARLIGNRADSDFYWCYPEIQTRASQDWLLSPDRIQLQFTPLGLGSLLWWPTTKKFHQGGESQFPTRIQLHFHSGLLTWVPAGLYGSKWG